MDKLIFDRTLTDVDIALKNPSNTSFLKGAYNYIDLNRVEIWCKYFQDFLNSFGKNINLEIKIDWNLRDYPTRIEIDRIRGNIIYLRDLYVDLETEIIEYVNTLDYKKANTLEKVLYDVNEYIESMRRKKSLPYNYGMSIAQAELIKLNADVRKRENDIYNKYGTALSKGEIIKLKVEEE